jgi:hypothetical protein
MRQLALASLAALTLAACGRTLTGAPAAPGVTVAPQITYSTPDETSHPFVGLLVFEVANGDLYTCTGALISPTVFLTAGHCTADAVNAWVSFAPAYVPGTFPSAFITGTPYASPNYALPEGSFNPAQLPRDTGDDGVVVLDQPVALSEYGVVADLNFLDQLATRRGQQNQLFTVVGYGIQSIKPVFQDDLVRYVATTTLVGIRSRIASGFNLRLSNNPGQAHMGGTCFGDSGGRCCTGTRT